MDVGSIRNNGIPNALLGRTETEGVRNEVQQRESQAVQKQEPEKEKKMHEKEIKPAVQAVNQFMEYMTADLHFKIHQRTDQIMVQLVSVKDQRVLREYPAQKFLDMVANIRDAIGLFLDKKI